MKRLSFLIIGFVILLVTGFGPYLTFSDGHSHHCPLVSNQASFCMTTLEHIEHWQSSFAAVLAELFVLIVIAFVLAYRLDLILFQQDTAPPLLLTRRLRRPTLLQELFSQGILNPRIP